MTVKSFALKHSEIINQQTGSEMGHFKKAIYALICKLGFFFFEIKTFKKCTNYDCLTKVMVLFMVRK